jgi:integrase
MQIFERGELTITGGEGGTKNHEQRVVPISDALRSLLLRLRDDRIESGVDIPTVSRWLGHKDGGALAMRVYGHLRQEHSDLDEACTVPNKSSSGFLI